MATKIQVYRLAAAAVGSGTQITDPADDTTIARSITGVWDLSRRAAIREGSWNFAMRRATPAALVTPPDFGFDFQFQLPAGILRTIEVSAGGRQLGAGEYQLEGGRVLCDESGPIEVRYLVDIEEPASWDDAFAQAFALKIALAIGTKIAGSAFPRDQVTRDYDVALAASKRVDAMENPPIEQEESDWILAREAGAGSWNPERPWG
jgi:hypothetical protein